MTADGTFIDLDQLQGGGPVFAAALRGLNERIARPQFRSPGRLAHDGRGRTPAPPPP